jgi:translation initiation factor 1
MRDDARPVYSTESGDLRGQGRERRRGKPAPAMPGGAPPADGVVRVGRTKAGRGGKLVTVVTGLPGDEAALKAVLSELKRLCGTGGTLRDGAVEVQGDHRDKVAAYLGAHGHRVKLTGG